MIRLDLARIGPLLVIVLLASCDLAFRIDKVTCSTELGGQCATCGQLGMECCSGELACVDNLFCNGGTCDRCITDVALGRRHACVVEQDRTLWCAGLNFDGQLGTGERGEAIETPTIVNDANGQPFDDVFAVAAGRAHTCALRRASGGTVWCMGRAMGDGRLGNGELFASTVGPVQVIRADGSPLTGMTRLAAGDCNTCALDEAGGAWCWGCNSSGQLGDGSVVHRPHASALLRSAAVPFTGIVELSLGNYHGCLRDGQDRVHCWGENSNGQLGDGTLMSRVFPVSVLDAIAIAAGQFYSCAVRPDRTLGCWGWGKGGRLGDGEDGAQGARSQRTPIDVVTGPDGPVVTGADLVSVGTNSCATLDGALWCWGSNIYGATGTGDATLVPAPARDHRGALITDVEWVRLQNAHGCASLRDGRVLCWGRNAQGEFGTGGTAHVSVPTPIAMTCE